MSVIVADTLRARVAGAAVTTTGGLNVGGACTATSFVGPLTGNVTGNVTGNTSGSSGSCSGNAATATLASGLTGTPDITIRNVTGVAATFTGVLTYEDVTNVDSVGIVTARSGIEFGAAGVGGTIAANGNATLAGIVTSNTAILVFGGGGTSGKGIEARSNSTQGTDTNKALRVRNNSDTNTFEVSYKGRVDAESFHGSGSGLTGLNIPAGFTELDAALFN